MRSWYNFYICSMWKSYFLWILLLVLFSCKNEKKITPVFIENDTPEYDSIVYDGFRGFIKIEVDTTGAGTIDPLEFENIKTLLREIDPAGDYVRTIQITPNYIRSDFSGDGVADYAVLTQNVKNHHTFLIVFNSEGDHHILGGGESMETGNLSLDWLKGISEFNDRETSKTVIDEITGDILGVEKVLLERNAIALKTEDFATVGLIYWDGNKYIYIH